MRGEGGGEVDEENREEEEEGWEKRRRKEERRRKGKEEEEQRGQMRCKGPRMSSDFLRYDVCLDVMRLISAALAKKPCVRQLD